ncbi:retrovirus-related pol polyprotein from transposon tnt 1-94 [Lasius niger]|uniref:Retrovirus-related pol polyprotein from transposon tnt 1-94 n=1 Tax=Lasius niger TaxID=67767 RepID=A0A0J7KN87_LASNI|nr:retrovirus-related pol polyprotein from transposon tnt 1-94 [Lasius niger]
MSAGKDVNCENCTYKDETDGKLPTRGQVEHLLSLDTKDVRLTDSEVSKHITYRREWLKEYRPCKGEMHLGDDSTCHRDIRIECASHMLAPRLRTLFLYLYGTCAVEGIGTVDIEKLINGVWEKGQIRDIIMVNENEENVTEWEIKVWHERLGHVNPQTIKKMVAQGSAEGIKLKDFKDFFCKACQLGKSHVKPFSQQDSKNLTKPGEFFHSDVCGPMKVDSVGGAKLFLTFKDDASGFRVIYFIKHKSDVIDKFKEFERFVANKFETLIKRLRTDNKREYCNKEMYKYLSKRGIQLENTALYTPQQNGRAERDNRTIAESARSMLHSANLPLHLWAEAVETAVYILNRTTSKQTPDTTRYELWMGKKPSLLHVRKFGSDAYIHIPSQ